MVSHRSGGPPPPLVARSVECRSGWRARRSAADDLCGESLDRLGQRLWQRQGLVLINPARIRNDWDRQLLMTLVTALYGPPHNR